METNPQTETIIDSSRIYRYCAGNFDPGAIAAHRIIDRTGAPDVAVVILQVLPASWRGDDRDIYEHIENWYRIRLATEAEAAVWKAYRDDSHRWKSVLVSLGSPRVASVDQEGIHTPVMPHLDSYDDRFDGSSKCINLTTEQFATYSSFQASLAAYKAACLSTLPN